MVPPGHDGARDELGTSTGWVIVRDMLLVGPWHHEDELSATHRRAPTDYDADHVLLRTVRCVTGDVQMELDCDPILDYGRAPVKWSYANRHYGQGVARAEGSDLELTLTTTMRIGFEGTGRRRRLVKETDDGLSGEEGCFSICSFWSVSALVEIGENDRASRLCERLLSYASPLGLYAEEIDPDSGRHLGNFPQAFTHLALINAVMHVIASEKVG